MKQAIAVLLILAVAGSAGAQEVRLTLKDAIRRGVENNLDVRAELFNAAAAEAEIRRSYGIYDPLLSVGASYQDSTRISSGSGTVFGTGSKFRQRLFQATPGVSQLLPTGGSVGFLFDNTYSNISGSPSSNWQPQPTVTLTQPLLRNFGRDVTELSINVAKFGKEGALEQFRARLMDLVTQVSRQYFQLRFLRENLAVKKNSLGLAEKILENTRGQIDAGVLPAMELLNAQFGVATRQQEVIDAERALKDQNDALRLLLQMSGGDEIVPVDPLTSEQYLVNEPAAVETAIASRPELKQLRVSLQSNELQARVASHRVLPDLSLTANAGLSGTDPSYSQALEQVGTAKNPVWEVGLQFSYPLGNRAARNDYIRSRLRVEQNQTQVKSLEETVVNEVRTATRAVDSSYRQLDVTARGKAYAEERLKAFVKKQQVGLATTKDVFDVENDLVTAQGNAIKALTDYNTAIVNLWRVTGELLDREGIRLDSSQEADELYRKFQ